MFPTLCLIPLTSFNNYCCLVAKLCSTLCDPMDGSLPGSSIHGSFQARILKWVDISSPGDLPDPRTELKSPTWQADSLPLSHLGMPIVFGSKPSTQATHNKDILLLKISSI